MADLDMLAIKARLGRYLIGSATARDKRQILSVDAPALADEVTNLASELRRERMWAKHFQTAQRLQAARTWRQRCEVKRLRTAVETWQHRQESSTLRRAELLGVQSRVRRQIELSLDGEIQPYDAVCEIARLLEVDL